MIGYSDVLVGGRCVRPVSGIALFPLPASAPALRTGRRRLSASAADFQEAKNVDPVGEDVLPNTAFAAGALRVVDGPTVTWLEPEANACMRRTAPLTASRTRPRALGSVRFFDGKRAIAAIKRRAARLYGAAWRNGEAPKGKHVLRAIVIDAKGRKAEAQRVVRICR